MNFAVPTLLVLSIGCTACAVPENRVLVRVESDPGVPLARTALRQDGQTLGVSDQAGLLTLTLDDTADPAQVLEVLCPDGFRAVAPVPEKDLQRPGEVSFRCRPELRSLVIAVRAPNAAHVPLRFLVREIARTDAEGAAHGVLRLAPGETAKLVLDTRADEHRWLRPRNPELEFRMPDRDEMVLFDQPFVVETPRPHATRASAVQPRR